jgi:hypothetical protein
MVFSMKKNSSAKKLAKKRAEKLELKHGYAGGFEDYLTVEGAALELKCSTRRVRQLLAAGTLKGYKHETVWQVRYPFILEIGSRGPRLNYFKPKSVPRLCIVG